MKSFITIILLFSFFLCQAQERTVFINTTANNGKPIDVNGTKTIVYIGTASDYLIPTTRDTIDFYALVSDYPGSQLHYYAEFKMAPITGADTTVKITVLTKKTANDSWETLKSVATSSAITTTSYVESTSLGTISNTDTTGYKYYPAWKPISPLSYRYILFRLILTGNDSVGTGIKVQRIELQFYPF